MQSIVTLNIYIDDPRFPMNKIIYLEYLESNGKIYAQFFGIPTHYIMFKDAKKMLYGDENADVTPIKVLEDLGKIIKNRFSTILADFITNEVFVGFTKATKKKKKGC